MYGRFKKKKSFLEKGIGLIVKAFNFLQKLICNFLLQNLLALILLFSYIINENYIGSGLDFRNNL